MINSGCKIARDRSREGTVLCLFSHAREEGCAQILAPEQQILAHILPFNRLGFKDKTNIVKSIYQ